MQHDFIMRSKMSAIKSKMGERKSKFGQGLRLRVTSYTMLVLPPVKLYLVLGLYSMHWVTAKRNVNAFLPTINAT